MDVNRCSFLHFSLCFCHGTMTGERRIRQRIYIYMALSSRMKWLGLHFSTSLSSPQWSNSFSFFSFYRVSFSIEMLSLLEGLRGRCISIIRQINRQTERERERERWKELWCILPPWVLTPTYLLTWLFSMTCFMHDDDGDAVFSTWCN